MAKIVQVTHIGGSAPIKKPRAKAIPMPAFGEPSILIHKTTHSAQVPATSLGALILGMVPKKKDVK